MRKKRFKIGDRVKTSHGTGAVVEIDGEKYLVDLNGQSAQPLDQGLGAQKSLNVRLKRRARWNKGHHPVSE